MAVGPRANPPGVNTLGRPPMSLLTVPGVVVGQGSARSIPRWQTGVGFLPDDCDVPLDWDGLGSDEDFPYWWECPGDGGDTPQNLFQSIAALGDGFKRIGAPEAVEVFDAITLWAGHICRLGGDDDIADAQERARRKLEALTPTAIEYELWTGQIANLAGFPNPALVDAGLATIINGGAPYGFITALGEIEQAIADVMPLTSPAIIHAQPRVVNAWIAEGLVDAVPGGTHLVTKLGTIVVAERGATGASPGSVVPAHTANYAYSWVYATGMVSVWLSPPRVSGAEGVTSTPDGVPVSRGMAETSAETITAAYVNDDPTLSARSINNMEVRAERDFIAAWNPCGLLAARVDLCDERCTGGS